MCCTAAATRMLAAVLIVSTASAQSGWQLRTVPVSPPPRGYHGLVYDLAAARVVLFGGWDGTYLGDMWLFDGAAWTSVAPTPAPAPRLAHAMAYDLARNRVVLFGGAVGAGAGIDSDETWEWNGAAWTQLQPVTRPSPRREVSMAFDPNRGVCVLFGGGATNFGNPVYNDTWEWNGATWIQRAPATVPPARWSSCLVADWVRGNVVLFGGSAGAVPNQMADTWTFDGTDWQQRTPVTVPGARRDVGGAFDVTHGVVLMYGGLAVGYDNTTWVWNGSDWRQDARQPTPPSQMSFALAYDVVRQRSVMFGGYAGSLSQQTWEYELGGLATWTPIGNGCPGPGATPSLAPVGTSLPVSGSTFSLRIDYGTGSWLSLLAVGVSDQLWFGGALPASLAALGMPGCTLHTSTEWLGLVPLSSGTGTLLWPLPASPAFFGFQFFTQAMVLDPGANPFGAVLSNAGAGRVGGF